MSLLDSSVRSSWRTRVVAVLLAGASFGLAARGPLPLVESASTDAVSLAELPVQARAVYRLILQGGPFRHDKDGVVFGNRERLLPSRRRGYYLEYTVDTPGINHRGPRRLVCGGPARVPDACYYTGDHYASFRRVAAGLQP